MAAKIRLRQQGRKNRQTYRVVVADSRSPRDGKYIEMLGWYDPMLKENNVFVNPDRMSFWLNEGAEISARVENLIAKASPETLKAYKDKVLAKRTKMTAKRRALKKA